MTTFIALLRGINVGSSNKKVPMAELRALMSGMGFGNVQTYIQSGNAVFTADEVDAEAVRLRVEAAIAKQFGFAVNVMALSATELADAIRSNPFASTADDPAKLHLGFMASTPDLTTLEALRTKPHGNDGWSVVNRVFYLHTPHGFGKSVLAPFVERTLKVPMTFRNWRTMEMLKDMSTSERHPGCDQL